VGPLVRHVEQVLGRGHALFGGPSSGGVAALDAGGGLAGAGQPLGKTRRQISGLAGALPVHYTTFATDAQQALDAAAGTDSRLRGRVRDAGRADHSGWQRSGAVVTGAATDTAGLAPVSGTPAGQRALIATLRVRLAQQQQVVNAYKARDARLAAAVRSLAYRGAGRGGSGAIPMGAMPFGAAPDGARPGGGGALGGWGGAVNPLALLARGVSPTTAAAAGLARPGGAVGTPLGALTPDSSPREVAAAIVHEAHRRGYSPYQTTAILADAMQESNLSPRAVSPNRLWVSIFQQDASYPGRHNPNLAIAEFFNRLDRHGGPLSPDIWKSIFWLQQRPGEPSAETAYTHGRQAYLREIQGQHHRAVAMYRDIVG
jgi:hypothetical protein